MKGYFAYKGKQIHFLSKNLKQTLGGKKLSKLACDFWSDISFNNLFQEGGIDLKAGKKPEKLLQRILGLSTQKGDMVLDFFSGSGTTAAVAHKMGRQYIGIEQMDYIEEITCERIKKVIEGEQGGISKSVDWKGGGEFIYCELAKWNEIAKNRINAFETFEELLGFYDETYDKYFIDYNLKIKEFKEKVIKEENFINLSLDQQKRIFLKMLDLNQMYVCKTERADSKFGISKEDQDLTEEFYDEGQ